MTREEHLEWCKKRAIEEYDYCKNPREKLQNGLLSMMSDMNKHPEVGSRALDALCMMQLLNPVIISRIQFVAFINGFN